MATEQVNLELQVTGFQSLKAQIKEAQTEYQKLLADVNASPAAIEAAASKVGSLKDELADANDTAKAFGTLGGKFETITRSLAGVAGGFSAVQGAIGLVGGDAKQLEGIMTKVQSAMALTQGLTAIADAGDAFKNLGKVIQSTGAIQKAYAVAVNIATVATRVFNAVIRANPIGLIITAIAGLVIGIGILAKKFDFLLGPIKAVGNALSLVFGKIGSVFTSIVGSTESAADIAKKNSEKMIAALDDVTNSTNIMIGNEKRKLSLLEAQGASEEALLAQKKKIAESEIKMRQDALMSLMKIVEAGGKLSDEQKKKVVELQNAIADGQQQIINNQAAYDKKVADDKKKADDAAAQKAKDAAQKRRDQAKQEADRLAQVNADAAKRLLDIQQENTLSRIKDDEQRAIRQLEFEDERARKEIEALRKAGAKKEVVYGLLAEQDKKYQTELTQIQENGLKQREEQRAAYDKQLLDLQQEYSLLSIENEQERAQKELEIQEQNAITAIEQSKFTEEQKQALILQTQQIYKQKQADLDQQYRDEQRAKEIADFQERVAITDEFNGLTLGKQKELFEKNKAEYQAQIDREAVGSERRKQLEKDYADYVESTAGQIADNRAASIDAVQGAIANVSQIVGENTAAGKALAVADAVINTYKGANQALGAAPPPFNFILAASVVAAGLVNVKKILSTKVDKNAASASGSAAAAATQGPSKFASGGLLMGRKHAEGGVMTPMGELEGGEFVVNRSATQAFLPLLNQINNLGNGSGPDTNTSVAAEMGMNQNPPIIKTYVVAADVTSQQEANKRISDLARL